MTGLQIVILIGVSLVDIVAVFKMVKVIDGAVEELCTMSDSESEGVSCPEN